MRHPAHQSGTAGRQTVFKSRLASWAAAVFLALTFLLQAGAATADQFVLPDGPNRGLVYGKCRTCHDLQYLVESKGIGADSWQAILEDMVGFGLEINHSEQKRLLAYLAAYMGPNPPPKTAKTAKPATMATPAALLFADNCISCHQKTGKGIEETFPPLADNPDLFSDRLLPVHVLLHGMNGKITVKGLPFDAEMPQFDHLSDGDIAALVNYIRGTWGNASSKPAAMAKLTAVDIAKARKTAMTPEQVHAYRQKVVGKTAAK